MKASNIIPAALLMISLGAGTVVYAEVGADSPPPGAQAGEHKDWHHHDGLLELLPDDKRKILHDAMEKNKSSNKALWEQAHKLHEERDAILKAPTFDEDAFLKKSAEIDAVHEKMEQSRDKTIADVASKFNPEERRVLLVMGHMMHHHGHHDHGGEWGHHGEGGKGTHDGPDGSNQPS